MEVVGEDEDLIKEGRLQRVEKRKREFMSRRLVQDIMGEVMEDVEKYRPREMETNWLQEVTGNTVEKAKDV